MNFRIMIMVALIAGCVVVRAGADEINPVVGRAGDMTLRESDLKRFIGYQQPEVQQRFQAEPEQRVTLVRQLLTTNVIATKVRKEGFDKKPEVMEQLSYLVDEFLVQEYLVKVVAAPVSVPDEELKTYYKEHEQEFLLPEKIKVRHIFIEVSRESGDEKKAGAKARADTVLLRLKQGEDFAKLAREVSDDAESAVKGGDLGTISPGKTNSEEFEKAAFSLKAGEISEVIASPFGYHIIRVDERIERRIATFEESRDYIKSLLKKDHEQRKVREFIEKSTKDAGMEVFTEKITGEKMDPSGGRK